MYSPDEDVKSTVGSQLIGYPVPSCPPVGSQSPPSPQMLVECVEQSEELSTAEL